MFPSPLQVHRRILADDWKGVEEPLNETGQFGDGLIVRGKHYLLLTSPSKAAYYHRTLAEEIYMAPSIMLMEGDEEWSDKFNSTVSKVSIEVERKKKSDDLGFIKQSFIIFTE